MSYREILLKKIEKLLNGRWTVPEFREEYYEEYLNHSSADYLNEVDTTFFGLIQEKLDWTLEKPSAEDVEDGYISYSQYTDWLRKNHDLFLSGPQEWYNKHLMGSAASS